MEMLTFEVSAVRNNDHASTLSAKDVELEIDSGVNPRPDALSPIELLLAAQAGCFLKGIERTAPTLNFKFSGVNIWLSATRPVAEARIEQISYRIQIATDESQERIDLLHKNLQKHGTIYNTLSQGTKLVGELVRAD